MPVLLELPAELILPIAGQLLPSQRDVSSLSRTHSALHQLVNPVLYRHSARCDEGHAIIRGVVTGNLAT
ncbi:hypothetical protein Micbo1qcDRAFT_167088, partial [Microdochium bolleyi]